MTEVFKLVSDIKRIQMTNTGYFISWAWTLEKRNLRFFSKFNHDTVSWFEASFRIVLGMLVTWWCLVNFGKLENPRKITKKIIKHLQVTSTPKTLRKLAWSHLTVLWLNFERNRRFLFILHGPSPTYMGNFSFQSFFQGKFEFRMGNFEKKTTSPFSVKKVPYKGQGS